MTPIRLRYPQTTEARRVTVDALNSVVDWMDGSVIGTCLLPKDRAVRFMNQDNEHYAKIGDWIVRIGQGNGRRQGIVLSHATYLIMFGEDR